MTDPGWDTSLNERVEHGLDRLGMASATAWEPLAGDASTRRYVRVTASDGSSLVLMLHAGPFDPESDPFLLVAELFRRMEIRVPSVVATEADLGLVALEDLGEDTLQRYLAGASADERRNRYVEAVTLVHEMQRRAPALVSSRYPPFALAFDVDKLVWELDFFVDRFLGAHRGAALPGDRRERLQVELVGLARELAAEPRVLCHRDFHSRNLMWHAGALHVIDFQDARMGPATYDLASLLRDCYVDQEPAFVSEMVDRYRAHVGPAGAHDLDRRFDTMSVQRHLKALGTFGDQAVRGRTRYLEDVPRTLGYLRDVFDRRPRFDRLRRELAHLVPELG